MNSFNNKFFAEAKKVIPGGVNSPVRSHKSVGGSPLFIKKASGSKIYDEKGKAYLDYCLSWGALILGHAHPYLTEKIAAAVKRGTGFGTATRLEVELARLLVEAVYSLERVRLTCSGTEAVMSALRLARAYTGRNKIIKFEHAYHGHADFLLAKAGSGLAGMGASASAGVPADFTKNTIVLSFNDLEEVKRAVKKHNRSIAAIIVEPVMANYGLVVPDKGFLQGLRGIADRFGIVLVFDEVITGFRLSYGGAQEYFGVKPDLTCLGKIIGGGLPAGAFGGKKEIMRLLAPEGSVYQAGTLSGNPVAVTAGITALSLLKRNMPYRKLAEKTNSLCRGLNSNFKKKKLGLRVSNFGSIFSFHSIKKTAFRRFFHKMLNKGIYFSPSLFEVNFLSVAHTDEDIERTIEAVRG